MNYIDTNKAAWEEAFENRHRDWGEENHELLQNEKLYFFNPDMRKELEELDLNGKTAAQFCCNNGRELLSLTDLGIEQGIGFDIAENILEQARATAEKAGIENCSFISSNILDIPESFYDKFDIILFTIGALTWFEDLTLLFEKAGKCLKRGGMLIINDSHPFVNMLPLSEEEGFKPDNPNRAVFSYFRKEPWIENNGMGYMTTEYKSKTFTSFSHTMSDIINALSENSMKTVKLKEYDYDIGMTGLYENKGFPLSYILIAEKST